MSKRDDGSPAFPTNRPGWYGMSLRDWFAGQALVGFLADSSQRRIAEALENDENRALIQDAKAKAAVINEQIAFGCYALADAMIAESRRS